MGLPVRHHDGPAGESFSEPVELLQPLAKTRAVVGEPGTSGLGVGAALPRGVDLVERGFEALAGEARVEGAKSRRRRRGPMKVREKVEGLASFGRAQVLVEPTPAALDPREHRHGIAIVDPAEALAKDALDGCDGELEARAGTECGDGVERRSQAGE